MKRTSLIVLGIAFSALMLRGQDTQPAKEEFKPSGKATGKIFFNYHYDLTKGVDQRSIFELNRVYLGYNYNLSEKARIVILFDGAKKSEASQFTVFVKNAFLEYKILDQLTVYGGMIETKQMDVQDKFGKYRYVYKPFHDEFGYGTTADLGINVELKPVPELKLNLFALNGEGFTKPQDNFGLHKFGTNILAEPIEGLVLKAYYEIDGGTAYDIDTVLNTDTCRIHSYDLWAGYKTDFFRAGVGYSQLINGENYYTLAEDYKLSGYYLNGAISFYKNFEIFGVWFHNQTDKPNDPSEVLNLLIGGIQYSPGKGINMALNYRTYFDNESETDSKSFVYLNFEFAF